jgi:hypothetical protein
MNIANTSGTLSVVTTCCPHHLRAGEIVMISGNSNSLFNGTWTIASVLSPTTFTFNQIVTPPQTGTGGTIAVDCYGLSNTAGITTVMTWQPHGFSVGQRIVVFGTSNDTLFSGVFTIATVLRRS